MSLNKHLCIFFVSFAFVLTGFPDHSFRRNSIQLLRKFSPTILLVLLLFLTGCAGSSGLQIEPHDGSFEKGMAAYESGDYAIAINEWKLAADQGHAKALYNLGVAYRDGLGTTQDYKAAIKRNQRLSNHAPVIINFKSAD